MTLEFLDIHPEVQAALAANRPVVALETTLIAHGLPRPVNLDCARGLERIIREAGAVPAAIGVLNGRIKIGLSAAELEHFATADRIVKISRRDLPLIVAQGRDGATTVAGTMILAAMAGIRVFATGGIGGVHRGGESSLDISADLTELGRTPVAVVCAGAKSILDLPRTLEVLETQSVPVIGYGVNRLPAFFIRDADLPLDHRVDSALEAAWLIHTHRRLGLQNGLLIAAPIPEAHALDPHDLENWIARAESEAETAGVKGKALTPFLLSRIAELSGGRTLAANLALLRHNAAIAAAIAVALADLEN